MTIRIYNTLSGKREPLEPIEPGHIKLYVCGITSYDYCHIGHARSALAFDMIVRYFKYHNYKVTYVRNFTDIDDKIIARAAEQNCSPQELANRFIDEFYLDMDRLGIDRPDIEPRATDHIPEMTALISELIDKGMAYQAGDDVYYKVDSFPEYGKLSGRNLEDMRAGARISVNEQKKNPMDFVLWKGSKPGEPTWESPWGPGRPGWHIECSAMSRKYLGETFDIHGGGKDLIFPHHENEIAQSEGANGKPFVTTWIHHGFVTIRDEKMSKSLGNFLTIRDILDNYHPEILRFFVFSTHYRNPLDFSETAMQDAAAGLLRLYKCIASVDSLDISTGDTESVSVISDKDRGRIDDLEKRFRQAMDNDFNTAQAQGIFFDTVKIINRIIKSLPVSPLTLDIAFLKDGGATLKKLGDIMGILRQNAKLFLDSRQKEMLTEIDIDETAINALVAERIQCRAEKNWARSDEIRDQLLEKNIELKDGPEGTEWTVKGG
ncbi:MAG: cysteine--tRNA ligase [Deltaproteobacteria bacterium]|nr:cysteine--tRNA ligase [Deltaproteobacteria bacterium]MBW2659172.1 cysteine--tRNA ligase [Deltaproteobacteria bacterium]